MLGPNDIEEQPLNLTRGRMKNGVFETYEIPKITMPEVVNQQDPRFEVLYELMKYWDINVPNAYNGYCGTNGGHIQMIMDALDTVK